jgi:hypothetical protein
VSFGHPVRRRWPPGEPAVFAAARPGSTPGDKGTTGSTSAVGGHYSALAPWPVRPKGAALQVILDLRRTRRRIGLLRRWSSLVESVSHDKYHRFAPVSRDQARSWVAARPETWVGIGWRCGRQVPVGNGIGGPVAATGVFDLHPRWALLGFVASIDGLLCLSDPLARRGIRDVGYIAGPPQTGKSERTRSTESRDSNSVRVRFSCPVIVLRG